MEPLLSKLPAEDLCAAIGRSGGSALLGPASAAPRGARLRLRLVAGEGPSAPVGRASASRVAASPRSLALAFSEGEGAAWCADCVLSELAGLDDGGGGDGASQRRRLASAFARAEAQLSAAHEDGRATGLSTTLTSASAVVVSEDGAVLHVAHVGDVVVLLVRDGLVVRRSRAHVPADAEEMRRVRAHGGFLVDGRVNGLVPVTRGLGFFSLKRLIHVLSPEPDVEIWNDVASGDAVVLVPSAALAALGGEDAVGRVVTTSPPPPRAGPNPSCAVARIV